MFFDRLWSGMSVTNADHAVVVDTHPYEFLIFEMTMDGIFRRVEDPEAHVCDDCLGAL